MTIFGCLDVDDLFKLAMEVIEEFNGLSFIGKLFEGLSAKANCPKETKCDKARDIMNCQLLRSQRSASETILMLIVLALALIGAIWVLFRQNKKLRTSIELKQDVHATQLATNQPMAADQHVQMEINGFQPNGLLFGRNNMIKPTPPPRRGRVAPRGGYLRPAPAAPGPPRQAASEEEETSFDYL